MIRERQEAHYPSEEITRILSAAGGLNRFGEPNYRAVWGGTRLDWIGGKWTDRDEHGNVIREVVEVRHVPKYFPLDRWHIERWVPPETYGSPEAWRLQTLEREDGKFVPALGPFPYRGDYEHSFTVEDADGNFVQLTPAIARHIALAIEFSRNLPQQTKTEYVNRAAEKQEREYDSFADSVLNDGSTITGPMVNVL